MPRPTPRSYLFVPGNRPDRFSKAAASGADAIILDLEDAVPFKEKVAAREHVAAWLDPTRTVFVRVNGRETDWFEQDLRACRRPGVAGILLPKAECADDIMGASDASGVRAILPLIETARGLWNVLEVAQCQTVLRLVFGSIDFQRDLGIHGDGEELLHARSRIVLASRVAGIDAPVDGICVDIDHTETLRSDALRAKRLGFRGKLCIHPRQVRTVNEAFIPSPEEVAWARRVVEASANAGGAAVAVDGKMVDRPVLSEAKQILAILGRSGLLK